MSGRLAPPDQKVSRGQPALRVLSARLAQLESLARTDSMVLPEELVLLGRPAPTVSLARPGSQEWLAPLGRRE